MSSIGNAKVAGMYDDLKLTSSDYSMALVIFFISYVIFEIPSNMILARTRPSLYIPGIMILWAVVTCCTAAVKNYQQLLAIRFLLGVIEAGFAPGIMLLLSCWYRKAEQAKRFAVFYSAAVLSGAFGGIVAGAITGNLDGAHGIRGWRWLFVCRISVNGCYAVGLTKSVLRLSRGLPRWGLPLSQYSSCPISQLLGSALAPAKDSSPPHVLRQTMS